MIETEPDCVSGVHVVLFMMKSEKYQQNTNWFVDSCTSSLKGILQSNVNKS